ncbi:MAG: nucleotide sugar dehydrogenase [Bacteroidota bacterium]
MFEQLMAKKAKIAVVGLGYVGLPIALEFAKYFSVVGFDISEDKVNMMKKGVDPSEEMEAAAFHNKHIKFYHQVESLKDARFYIVAVPTPIDEYNQPDLRALKSATRMVAQALKPGDYVVFESTVYPGCTEDICVPILEKISGLTFNKDFKVGYSPERINPGDKVNTIDKIVKIVSGSCEKSLDIIAEVYGLIIKVGIHKAPSLKVAEAAKIVENTQRDVNIALMNELSMIFEKAGINTYDVLQAAGTKWNFLNFYPGLVGGHCIGVDPYYLIQRAIRLGHNPILISAGRTVNDGMPARIAGRIMEALRDKGIKPKEAKVLVQGITFKEDVADVRNSKAAELAKELNQYCAVVDVVDPHASPKEVRQEYDLDLRPTTGKEYDVVVVAVSHKEYMEMDEAYYRSIGTSKTILFDVKGILRGKIDELQYLSL